MFLLFLFTEIVKSEFDPMFLEVYHIYNKNCKEYDDRIAKNKGKLTIDSEATGSDFIDIDGKENYLRECKNIGEVEYKSPDSVPEFSFYHSSITKITFGPKVTGIGEGAFACCYLLETVTFDANPSFTSSSISEGAFCNSALKNINLPSVITTISKYTFYGCPITNLDLSNIGTINEKAFYNSKITRITSFKAGVTIGNSAFENCALLEEVGKIDATQIGKLAFLNAPKVTEIDIICGKILEGAFRCTTEKRRIINSITQGIDNKENRQIAFGPHAFYGCTINCKGPCNFKDVSIDKWAFAYTQFKADTNANSIGLTIENKNSILTIGDYAFYQASFGNAKGTRFQLTLESGTSSEGTVGYHAFDSTTGDFTLKIVDEGLFNINNYAFYKSSVYNDAPRGEDEELLTIPSCVGEIGAYSFADCQRITGGVLIRSAIGERAFYNCQHLKNKIIIMQGNSIGKGAFENCVETITNLTITHPLGVVDNDEDKITIGERAFYNCKGLSTPLVLHSFISTISEYAFAYCTALGSNPITIYATTIQPYAFLNCETFSSHVTIYSTKIQFHCFDNDVLGDLTIESNNEYSTEDSMNQIESYAFYSIKITGLLTIKSNVNINEKAFSFCTFSNNILIDSEIIGEDSFQNCTITQPIQVSIGPSKIGSSAFAYFAAGSEHKFTLVFHDPEPPQSGTPPKPPAPSIGPSAFAYSNIKDSLDIPSFCGKIYSHAFFYCSNITSIKIDDIDIGNSAFEGCSAVQSLTLHSHGNMKVIGKRAFYQLQFVSSITIPSSVTRIDEKAFYECKQSTLLEIPTDSALGSDSKNLKAFGAYAFYNCASLSGEVYIPKAVKYIGQYAFYGCSSLKSFTFHKEGSQLIEIGSYAFCDCSSINGYLDIPESVVTIGEYAFYNCQSISNHLFIHSACDVGDNAFKGCNKITGCHLNFDQDTCILRKIGSHAFYELPVAGNLDFRCTTIGESAFEGAREIKGVTIELKSGSTGTGIGRRAFYNSGITSLTIDAGDYQVNEYAFANCLNLNGSINIEGGEFWGHVFDGCINLEKNSDGKILDISGGKLGPNNFNNCPKFGGKISISNCEICDYAFERFTRNPIELETEYSDYIIIGKRAFYGSSLTGDLTLSYVTWVGDEAFANCPNVLKSLDLDAKRYGKNVFSNTRFNETLIVNDGTSFDQFTLQGASGFKSLDLTYISDIPCKAFYKMSSFEGILYIPENVEKIRPYAFSETGFCEIIFTENFNDITIGEGAFSNCKQLNGTIHNFPLILNQDKTFAIVPEKVFAGCTNLLSIDFKDNTKPRIYKAGAFSDCSNLNFDLSFENLKEYNYTIHKNAFSGCTKMFGDLIITEKIGKIEDYAFANSGISVLSFKDRPDVKIDEKELIYDAPIDGKCQPTTVGDSNIQKLIYDKNCNLVLDEYGKPMQTSGNEVTYTKKTKVHNKLILGEGVFSGCDKIVNDVVLPTLSIDEIPDRLFSGCSGIQSIEFPPNTHTIGKYAFSGCSSLHGSLDFSHDITTIKEYAFSGCRGFSNSLIFRVDPASGKQLYIGAHAFDGCKGFKKGSLTFIVESDEEDNKYSTTRAAGDSDPYFKYKYFLRIGNQAFEDTDFKDVYYNGRFQPDCDYDIGIKKTKGIHTSTNYLNKSFCDNPVHSDKLSGGAIAGITIAVIVVVAAIVVLIIFLILRNKKKKDKSEDEVEMNADP